MTETSRHDGEVVVTLVYEGSTLESPSRTLQLDVEGPAQDAAATDERTLQKGSLLSHELLSQVDLTPKATEVQDSWGWEIAAYLYLGGLGAGTFIVAVLLDWMGVRLPVSLLALTAEWNLDWAAVLMYWGPLIAALGASLLILHLGRNWFLFFTACFNPRSSWLARGFLILATFIIVGGLAFLVAVFLPGWTDTYRDAWRTVQTVGVVFACGTAIYTGILLRSMKYIPAWNAVLLPFLFFVSALSTGAMGVVCGALVFRVITGDAGSIRPLIERVEAVEPILLLVEGAVLLAYLWRLSMGKPEARLSVAMLVSGGWRYPFCVGVVGGAFGLPLLLAFISRVLVTDSSTFSVYGVEVGVANMLVLVAAISVLCGGFLLRIGVLSVGIKERPPLYGMSMWRAEHGLPLAANDLEESWG